jgi:hypothetical protein
MIGIEANPFEASQAPEGRAAASSGRGATVFRDVLAEDERGDAGEQVGGCDGEQGYEPADAPGGGDGAAGQHDVVEAAHRSHRGQPCSGTPGTES